MNKSKLINTLPLITVIGLILTGCGGGSGGGSSTPTTPTEPSTPTTPTYGVLGLTTDNYDDYSLLFNRSLYNEVASIRTGYHTPSDDAQRLVTTLWLNPSLASSIKTAFINTLPAGAGTHNCTTGSMTRTLIDSNNDGLINQAGESEQLSFNNCSNGILTVNGSMAYSIGAKTTTTLSATVSYNNLTGIQNNTTQSYQGSKSVSIDTAAGLTVNSQVVTEIISLTQSSSASSQSTQKVGYQSRYQETGTDWQASLAGGMEIIVNNEKASLTIATATPLTGSMASGVYTAPRTGEYSTQWNSQSLKTSSNADGLLTMSADLDANGSYEVSYQQAWDRLTIPE